MDIPAIFQKIDQLIFDKNLLEAFELCEKTLEEDVMQEDYCKLISIEVKILVLQSKEDDYELKQQKLEEALFKIEKVLSIPNLEQEDKKSYLITLNQKSGILRKVGREEEALEVIEEILSIPNPEQENKKSYLIALNQKSDILRKVEREEEALEVIEEILSIPNPEQENKKSYLIALGQKRDILRKLGRKKEALGVIEEILSIPNLEQEDKKNYLIALNQKRDILRKLGMKKEALGVIEEILSIPNLEQKDRKNYLIALNQKHNILKIQPNEKELLEQDKKEIENLLENNYDQENILSQLFTRIYYNTITVNELESVQLEPISKTILLVAYYEKYNKKQASFYLNQQKYLFEGENRKIYNKLKERVISKKTTFFGSEFYCQLLNCTIDQNYKIETNAQREVKTNFPTFPNQVVDESPNPKKAEKKHDTIIVIEGKRLSKFEHSVRNKNLPNKPTIAQVPPKETKIKDVFAKELEEIGKQIYVQMQSQNPNIKMRAVQAWDLLMILSDKSIHHLKSLRKMIQMQYPVPTEIKLHDLFATELIQTKNDMLSQLEKDKKNKYILQTIQKIENLSKQNIGNKQAFLQMMNLLEYYQKQVVPLEEEKIAQYIKTYYTT